MLRYEAYKESGVEWIGQIPEEWGKCVRAKRCIESRQNGKWGNDCEDDGEGKYCLRAADFDYQHLCFKEPSCFVRRRYASDEFDRIRLEPGDLIVEKSGGGEKTPVGRAILYRGGFEAGYSNFLERVRVRRKQVDPSFFFYWWTACYQSGLFTNYFSQTTGIQNLNTERLLSESVIVLPPYEQQRAIADYLDTKTAEIDALVEDCEREVGLLREYRKAVISEAVTKGLDPDVPMKDSGVEWIGAIPDDWEVVGFKTYLNGIIDYRGRTPEKVDDGVFLITGRNIKQGRIHYELSQEYMRPEDFDTIMSRGRLKVGNVLFTMEAPLGEVALIDRDDCAAAQRIIQLCCNENELFGAFLVYWIMSDEFQSDLQTYATGSTASGIKASKLGMLRLMHPPMETQHSIVDYLDAKTAEIDSLIETKQSMADKLREYRRSLISEAVTGKFKVPGV